MSHAAHRSNRGPQSGSSLIEPLESRLLLTMQGQQLFPADNPWNQNISQAPVAANSATIMNAIVGRYGDGRLHPDFGQDYKTATDLYGIPYNIVHGNTTAKVRVVIDAYADESDLLDVPIPADAVIEGDYQNGPKAGVDNRGDSHLLIWDVDNNIAYEFGRASRPSENSDGKWHADCEAVWDMKTDAFRTIGWTSVDAAGLSVLAGLVRPDEGLPTSEGGQGVINHAIRFTLQNAVILNQFLYPAEHVANPGNTNVATQPPMGARFRLKASVDISQMNPEARIIAQAMKDYGMIAADNGSNFYFSGASYSVDASNKMALTWNDNDIQDSVHGLKSLHYSDFEVVDLTPVVTSLSANNGAVGSQITITGRNFSGAAGHLQVLFGNTPATLLNILDDSHLLVGVPNGSGTVDVRVQSGVSDPGDSQNVRSPIFGYGVSATSQADRFTFSGTVVDANHAPTSISISSLTTAEGQPAGTVIGTLAGTDPDAGQSATLAFSLVPGFGDDALFSIDPVTKQLKTNAVFSYQTKSSYSIEIHATDTGSPAMSLDKVFTISVTSVAVRAPVIAGIGDDTGTPGDGITSDRTLLINGTAQPGMLITVYRGSTRIGTTTADSSGLWIYDYTRARLANGRYAFSARATDSLKRVSPRSTSYFVTVDGSAPKLSRLVLNDGRIQRSMVDSVTIRFTEATELAADAVLLSKHGGGDVADITLSVANPSGDRKTYVITFSGAAVVGGSLADGDYDLTIVGASIHDAAGNPMASTYVRSFFRHFGDCGGDRIVGSRDNAAFKRTLGKSSADRGYVWYLDFDGNGIIDSADQLQFNSRLGTKLL